MDNLTFGFFKPDGLKNMEQILNLINTHGFTIIEMSVEKELTRSQAEQFYAVHKERPYFDSLIRFTIKGKIVAFILRKNDAINGFRKLLGNTDPAKAEEGTIRKLFGNAELYAQGIPANVIHASDSHENFLIESKMFFPEFEPD